MQPLLFSLIESRRLSHTKKVRLRQIETEEIEEAICKGAIIEPYPDPRGASCLILRITSLGRPLHVICGRLYEDEILVITAYEPDPEEWESDLKTRKKGGLHQLIGARRKKIDPLGPLYPFQSILAQHHKTNSPRIKLRNITSASLGYADTEERVTFYIH